MKTRKRDVRSLKLYKVYEYHVAAFDDCIGPGGHPALRSSPCPLSPPLPLKPLHAQHYAHFGASVNRPWAKPYLYLRRDNPRF